MTNGMPGSCYLCLNGQREAEDGLLLELRPGKAILEMPSAAKLLEIWVHSHHVSY